MLPRLAKLGRTALSLLFPLWCLGCGREGVLICPSCRSQLPRITPPICLRCGLPKTEGTACPDCSDQQPAIDGVRAPFRFEGIVRRAIHELKYRNLRAAAEPLSELLGHYLMGNHTPAEVLVPVPLHQKRLRERGYNQSELLAAGLSKRSGLPVSAGCLIRLRHSLPQAQTASVSDRQKNVATAFACRDRRMQGKKVLLIDDVATSGATLNACAAALKASGAISVWGLTLAREV
ncbi:MAG: ComF family protein [Dehalococcoidales bacterium]|nr:ComF family protein [Dehalococcoidales bacterium]